MASYNRVILMGNLTRDPEVRFLPSGKAVCALGLAVSSKYKTQDGQEHEEVCFVTCEVYGKQAENCGKYLSKGRQVLMEGRLRYEQWEKDGQKRSALKVIADRVQFLGGGKGGEAAAAEGGSAGRAAAKPAREEAAPEEPPAASPEPVAGAGDDDNLPF
jgi:single-strand DNA-binding protein